MCSKFVGITVAVFVSLFVMPFVVYADDDYSGNVETTVETIVSDTELEYLLTEPEQQQTEEIQTELFIDDFAVKAVEDVCYVLDESDISYSEQLQDELYLIFSCYMHDDNTEYCVEVIRSDVHDIIVNNIIDGLSYTDEVEKSVDKVFDDIFVITSDNQDIVFLSVVQITLLAIISFVLFMSYFMR